MSDFFVMPQYASLWGKLVLKTVIHIPPLFVSSQTKRAYICSKRDCKSFVKTQTKAVRFSKLRKPQTRTL